MCVNYILGSLEKMCLYIFLKLRNVPVHTAEMITKGAVKLF